MMMRIRLFPEEAGRPVIKSRAMCDHGRCGVTSGWRRPEGCLVDGLLREQAGHAATYSFTSLLRDGHQKYRLRNVMGLLTPGWHVNRAVWAQWISAPRAAEGTKRRPGGPVPGSGSSRSACWMISSVSQERAPMRHAAGKISDGSEGSGSEAY